MIEKMLLVVLFFITFLIILGVAERIARLQPVKKLIDWAIYKTQLREWEKDENCKKGK